MRQLTRGLFFVLACTLLFGCAAQNMQETFTPVDLSQKIRSGHSMQKVDNFIVVFDSSSSMFLDHNREMKSKQATRVANNMNMTIPTELDMQGGLRVFGPGAFAISEDSTPLYGMTKYSQAGFKDAMTKVTGPEGSTPLAGAITIAGADLAKTSGDIAMIIISDAEDVGQEAVASAKAVKATYGDRICIYTVLIGNAPNAKEIMEQIANAGGCGYATDYDAVNSSAGMAKFVEDVFLEPAKDTDGDGVYDHLDKCPGTPKGTKVDKDGCPILLDSDGDGVYDNMDKCPGTPKGVKVDKDGCPLDSDGDGVYDYEDRCPGTPKGITVDKYGCPIPIKGPMTIELKVEFDYDKYFIRPRYHQELKEFADFLKAYPDMKVKLEGHTDNKGSDEYNNALAKKRAESVKKYLVTYFDISTARLNTVGYGETKPISDNGSDAGRQRNRRVYAILNSK